MINFDYYELVRDSYQSSEVEKTLIVFSIAEAIKHLAVGSWDYFRILTFNPKDKPFLIYMVKFHALADLFIYEAFLSDNPPTILPFEEVFKLSKDLNYFYKFIDLPKWDFVLFGRTPRVKFLGQEIINSSKISTLSES